MFEQNFLQARSHSYHQINSNKAMTGTINTYKYDIVEFLTNLNNGVATIKKSNGELYGFLKDATRVVADDEVNHEISCTVAVQVTLLLQKNKPCSCYAPQFMLLLLILIPQLQSNSYQPSNEG